jgi:flavin-dependent thymidylate synthase
MMSGEGERSGRRCKDCGVTLVEVDNPFRSEFRHPRGQECEKFHLIEPPLALRQTLTKRAEEAEQILAFDGAYPRASWLTADSQGKGISRWADAAMFRSEPMPTDEQGRVTPKAYLLNATPDPLGSLAALNAIYTGEVVRSLRMVTDPERRTALEEVRKNKLQGPLEVIQFHFLLEGVSRAFTHQIVRGRHAFYAQESLRFAVVEGEDWTDRVAVPPGFEFWDQLSKDAWNDSIEVSQQNYDHLVSSGVPAEDARGLMPHAMTTRIHWVCSLRELLYVAGVRLCTQAQFEWRTAMASVVKALREYGWVETMPADSHRRPTARPQLIDTRGDGWQFVAMADLLRPICYQEGACGFKAKADRSCTIRDRVDRNEALRIPSSQWAHGTQDPAVGDTIMNPVLPIDPAEWLADPNAAR